MSPDLKRSEVEAWSEISSRAVLDTAPLVSVVMLSFNHEQFLHDAVSSVLLQETDFPFELVIGDDCSTDASFAILRALQEAHPARIRLISPEANVGMFRNFARLVTASRGEFIAFCEGDDYWSDPGKLQKQADFLARRADFGAVHTGYASTIRLFSAWRLGPGRTLAESPGAREGDIFAQLLRGNFIQTCTFLARAQLVKSALEGGLNYPVYPVVDWPLFLHISARSRIGYLPCPTAVYRRVPGSAMNAGADRALEVSRLYEPMLEEVFALFNVEHQLRVDALASLHCAILSQALIAGNTAVFEKSWDWLQVHAPDMLEPRRRRVMPIFMHSRVMRAALLTLLKLKKRWGEIARYRRVARPARV